MKPEAHSSTKTAGAASTAASASERGIRFITNVCSGIFSRRLIWAHRAIAVKGSKKGNRGGGPLVVIGRQPTQGDHSCPIHGIGILTSIDRRCRRTTSARSV